MPLSPLPISPVPAFTGFTQNSETSGGVVGSFDLLCLFGVIVLVLEADTFTASTGVGESASRLCCEDATAMEEHEHLSVVTTDSSAPLALNPHSDQADSSQFKFSFDNTDGFNPASLLVALGGFVALLMKNALH